MCSDVGMFGSTTSSVSIWNQFSRFGNKFRSESPWNSYSTTNAPVVVDSVGNFYGYFSANSYYPKRTSVPALASLLAMARDNESGVARTVLCGSGQASLSTVPRSNASVAVMPECGSRPQMYGNKWDIASLALWSSCNVVAMAAQKQRESAGSPPASITEKLNWYRTRAMAGSSGAQFELGAMYFYRDGVAKDFSQALYWWRRSNEGFPEPNGQFLIATLYYDGGPGLQRDDSQAAQWMRLSANQGHDDAQYYLAYLYAQGTGVPKDIVSAYMWMSLAANSSRADMRAKATSERDSLLTVMTLGQVADAEQKARDWAIGKLGLQ